MSTSKAGDAGARLSLLAIADGGKLFCDPKTVRRIAAICFLLHLYAGTAARAAEAVTEGAKPREYSQSNGGIVTGQQHLSFRK